MRTSVRLGFGILVLAAGLPMSAQQATAPTGGGTTQIQKNVEAYLRHLYAFGTETTVKVDAPKETGVPGFQEVDIEVKIGEQHQNGKVYVSKDGKYIFRGELADMSKDPLAEARAQIQMTDAPALGDAKAPVTLVEYSDFECPICRSLHDELRALLPRYPQVRVVFKDFPLEQIHPWARTAALAGRCAYEQDPKTFWKMYDLIYDNQDVISAENAWNKMLEFAATAGANADTLKACMASPVAGAAVDASKANGQLLEVGSTPTIFINGRRVVGVDARLIEQYIKYELEQHRTQTAAEKN